MVVKVLLVVSLVLLCACQTIEDDDDKPNYVNEELEWDNTPITNCIVNNKCDYESVRSKSFLDRLF